MVNEVLCKILCHIPCCRLQSQCELGLGAEFWGEEFENSTDVVGAPIVSDAIAVRAWVKTAAIAPKKLP